MKICEWRCSHKTRSLLTPPHLSRCPFQRWRTAAPWKLHLAPFQAPGDQWSCSKSPPSGTLDGLLPQLQLSCRSCRSEIAQICDQSPTFLSNGIIIYFQLYIIIIYNYNGPVYQRWDGTSFILATCETVYGQIRCCFLGQSLKALNVWSKVRSPPLLVFNF
jgi:hypothetical protein